MLSKVRNIFKNSGRNRLRMRDLRSWVRYYVSPTSPAIRRLSAGLWQSKERTRFYAKLGKLLDNNIPLHDAIRELQSRAAKRGQYQAEAVVLTHALESINRGGRVVDGLADYVSADEYLLLDSGEGSNQFSESLKLIRSMLKAKTDIRKEILQGLAKPLLLLAAALAVLYIFGARVMPEMMAMFSPSDLSGATYWLYLVSTFLTSPWGWALLGAPLFIMALLGISLKYWVQSGRHVADRFPPWSFYRLITGGGWLIALGSLVQAGVPLVFALERMRFYSRNNPYLRTRIEAILREMNRGRNFGDATARAGFDFPDPEIIDDLTVYARLPGFDKVLHRIALDWVDEGVERVRAQASVANQIATVMLGAAVAWIGMGMLGLYELTGGAGNTPGGF